MIGSYEDEKDESAHPRPAVVTETDFSGEPVTFLASLDDDDDDNDDDRRLEIMESLDRLLLGVVSRGRTCDGGGDDGRGLSVRAAHSFALDWCRAVRCCSADVPLTVVAATAPLLAQTGASYVRRCVIARLPESQSENLWTLAHRVVEEHGRDEDDTDDSFSTISPRERALVVALGHLLREDLPSALVALERSLLFHPGDVLALSLSVDVARTLGDAHAAARVAAGVAVRHADDARLGAAWVAVGAAASSPGVAETLAARAHAGGVLRSDAAGVASWALALAYAAEGRSAEGVTATQTFDGREAHADCGFLSFEGRTAGYGARFSLDRSARGDGAASARTYDESFDRMLETFEMEGDYGRVGMVLPSAPPPRATLTERMDGVRSTSTSFWGRVFGGSDQTEEETKESYGAERRDDASPQRPITNTMEDVLTFLPPTTPLLVDATLLLLRLTFSEIVTTRDERWQRLGNAWRTLHRTLSKDREDDNVAPPLSTKSPFEFHPMAEVLYHLFCPLVEEKNEASSRNPTVAELSRGLSLLGRCLFSDDHTDDDCSRRYGRVVRSLSAARVLADRYPVAWDADARVLFEHALCLAALRSDAPEDHYAARAVCGASVTFRPSCPEAWFRFGAVLDACGETAAARSARDASVALGAGAGGEGGAGTW